MAYFRNKVDPERLIQAADAALIAAVEAARHNGGASPHPVDLMSGPTQPDCLTPFTKSEVQEACDFLVRLGVMRKQRAKGAA